MMARLAAFIAASSLKLAVPCYVPRLPAVAAFEKLGRTLLALACLVLASATEECNALLLRYVVEAHKMLIDEEASLCFPIF